VKKKYSVPPKEKKDWFAFTKEMGDIKAKETDILKKNLKKNNFQKLDLHGYSLIEANNVVKKFIIKSFKNGYKKALIVTGKGIRSKSYSDPYQSEKLSILKYSVPDFIKSEKILIEKINKITKAEQKDGGEGAFYIFFKNNKNL
jgi:DNA-nicking Smr family endonuclease